uniref:Uncharacterized protein n=1 Tax=Rhizophora mucronata TaxID=61149 RepID=A0A2P2PX49_RHIMU
MTHINNSITSFLLVDTLELERLYE